VSADYSQIELRLLAHASEDEHLINAFKTGEDIHTLTAAKVFGVSVQNVTKDMRQKAKAVNFGIVYGQSKYGLAKNLKISNSEAQDFIDKYFDSYPSVKKYMEDKKEFANMNGYVETLYGRKRYLASELQSPNFQIREFAQRAAINQPLQGTAADLIKMAMIKVDKLLKDNQLKAKMIMQVHDELVFEVPESELDVVMKLVTEAMELDQPLRVPLLVDINYGLNWKEG
jgi:DNA polymerase-1